MAVSLHHHRAGRGEPLVALHGIGSTWRVWKPILPALEQHHDVLALDLPGYGESAPLSGAPTVYALGDAVEREMDEAGIDTAHLLGNSMGGFIAAELAARGRARSAVVISPAGLHTEREAAFSTRSLKNAYALAQHAAPFAERICSTALGRWSVFWQVSARPHRLDPVDSAHALRVFADSPSFPATIEHLRRAMPRGLETIDVPFLVIWGTRDLLLPRRQGPRWARIVPDAELLALPGLGHVPMGDDPGLTAAKILEVTTADRPIVAAPG